MLITDDFVFAHIPKTGGEFMQAVIRRHFRLRQAFEGHDSHRSLEDLPAEHRGKPVFALLRNPWAWYVSWFSYCAERGDNPEFRHNAVGEPPDFADTLRQLLTPRHTDEVITEFMGRERIGLLEMHRFHILDLEDASHPIHYGRLEHLGEDFMAFLDGQGIETPPGLAESLAGEPLNRSDHAPWRSVYPDDLRDRVAELERHIIALGNYRFGE